MFCSQFLRVAKTELVLQLHRNIFCRGLSVVEPARDAIHPRMMDAQIKRELAVRLLSGLLHLDAIVMSAVRVPWWAKGGSTALCLLSLVACGSKESETPVPTPVAPENVVREAPAMATRTAVQPTPASGGHLVAQLDFSRVPIGLDQAGRLALMQPGEGSLEAGILDLETGLRVGGVRVGHQKVLSVGASDESWFVLLERGQVVKAPLLGGESITLQPVSETTGAAPCRWTTLTVDPAGVLAGAGEKCAARLDGERWSVWSLPLPLREASIAASKDWTVVAGASIDGYVQAFRWHHGAVQATTASATSADVAPAPVAAPAPPPAGDKAKGSAGPAKSGTESAASSPVEVFAWEGQPNQHPKVQAALGEDGTLWLLDAERGIASLPPTVGVARSEFRPLSSSAPQGLSPVWLSPDRQEILGISPQGLLVRLDLGTLKRKEQGRLGGPDEALISRRFLNSSRKRVIGLVPGEGAPANGEAMILDLDRWLTWPLPSVAPIVRPCAMASTSDGRLAMVSVSRTEKTMETFLTVFQGGNPPGLKWYSVAKEDPGASGEEELCLLVPSEEPSLFAVYSGKTLKLYNVESHERVGKSSMPGLAGLAFSPDGGSIYVAKQDGSLARTEVPGLDDPAPLTRYDKGIVAFGAVPGSDLLLIATPSENGFRVESFAAERLRVLGSANLTARPLGITAARQGGTSLIWTADQSVMLWNTSAERGALLPTLQADQVVLSGSGQRLFLGSDVLRSLPAPGGGRKGASSGGDFAVPLASGVRSIAPLSDGKCIASLDGNGRILLVNSKGKSLLSLWLLPSQGHMALGEAQTWAGTDNAVQYLANLAISGQSVVSAALPAPSASLLADSLRACSLLP